MIRKNNSVCFEIDMDTELVEAENACGWGMKYYSIIGFGKAFLVDDFDEKRKALDIIMEHYSGKSSFEYSEEAVINATIIKVEMESMTGEKSPDTDAIPSHKVGHMPQRRRALTIGKSGNSFHQQIIGYEPAWFQRRGEIQSRQEGGLYYPEENGIEA